MIGPSSKVNLPEVEIWTEGKTDWKHLKHAFARVGGETRIVFHEKEEADMGDQALHAKCKTFAQTSQPTPKVLIFDCDNKTLLPDVTAHPQPFKAWGNNVFSFALPIPSHRSGFENVC